MKNKILLHWFVIKYGLLLKVAGWFFMIPILLGLAMIAKLIFAILFNQIAFCADYHSSDYVVLQTWFVDHKWMVVPVEPGTVLAVGPLHEEVTVPNLSNSQDSPDSLYEELLTPTDGRELQRSPDYNDIIKGPYSRRVDEHRFLVRTGRRVYNDMVVVNPRIHLPFRYFDAHTDVVGGVRGIMTMMGDFYPILDPTDYGGGYLVIAKSYAPGFSQTIAFKHLEHVSVYTEFRMPNLIGMVDTFEWYKCPRLRSMLLITTFWFVE